MKKPAPGNLLQAIPNPPFADGPGDDPRHGFGIRLGLRVAPFPKVGERPPRDLGLGEIDRHHVGLSVAGFFFLPHTIAQLLG